MNIQVIDQNQALKYVQEAIINETGSKIKDPKQLNLDTEFNYHLDLTSLDIAEILISIEKQTGLDLDSNTSDIVSLGNVCHLIQKRAAFAAIKTLLSKEVLDEATVAHLKPWTNLQTDLGMDSIEIYDLYALIEENFKIAFPPKTKETTVGKLCDLIIYCQNSKTTLNNIWKHIAIKKHRKKTRKFAKREQILPKIKEVMFKEGMITLHQEINFDTNLEKDLRLDFYDKLNLNCQLNRFFEISLPDNADYNTVGEVCDNVIKYSKLEAIVRNISPNIIQMLSDVVAKKELSIDNIKPESYMRKIFSKRDALLEQDLFAKRIKEKYHVDISDKLSQIETPKELCFYIAEQMVIARKNIKKQTSAPANAFQNARYHIVQDLGPILLKKNWIQEPVSLVSEIELKTTSDYFALARIIKKKYNVGFINNAETMKDLSEQIIKSRINQFRKSRRLTNSVAKTNSELSR